MRELVYLSEAKLAQFLPGPRGGWHVKGSVTTPVGSVDVDPVRAPDAELARRLERVIEQVARDARWYTDEGLRPGQGVQFEAPLNYGVLDERYFDQMVVFLDSGRPAPNYAAGGAVRLLLHGSGRHLAGAPRSVQLADQVQEVRRYGWSGGGGQSGFGPSQSPGGYLGLAQNVEMLVATMNHAEQTPKPQGTPRSARPDLAAATRRLIEALETRMYPETAAWMTGYARVTVALRDGDTHYVVASPLNVEHTDSPEPPERT